MEAGQPAGRGPRKGASRPADQSDARSGLVRGYAQPTGQTPGSRPGELRRLVFEREGRELGSPVAAFKSRSEEHTSELQSPCNLVCRLLLEKKKKKYIMA